MGERLEFYGKGPLKKGVLMLQNCKVVKVGESFEPKDVDRGVLEDLKKLKPPAVGPITKKDNGKKGGK